MTAAQGTTVTRSNSADLNVRLAALLEERLCSQSNYSRREVSEVSSLAVRIFPAEPLVEDKALERFRTLCQLYRCELPALREISSHRPIIGPVIVFGKRLLWRLMHSQLRQHFEHMQEFHLRLVEELGEQIAKSLPQK